MRLEALEERTLLSLTLIKDINPAPLYPAEITGAGGNVYFVTKAADGGSDLDVKTATGTTAPQGVPRREQLHLRPDARRLEALLLRRRRPGPQLWVTNGTRAGTRLVKNAESSGADEPTVVGNELYFTADVIHGNSVRPLLFKSNGTAAGTVPVAMPAGSANSDDFPGDLVDYDGALYFGVGDRLMKTQRHHDQGRRHASAHPMRTRSPPGPSAI